MGKQKVVRKLRMEAELQKELEWLGKHQSEDRIIVIIRQVMQGTLQWVLGEKQSPTNALIGAELQRLKNGSKAGNGPNSGKVEAGPVEGPAGQQVGKDPGEPV